ncbi:MAG: CBS domain-containing protein [Candidatus Kapabacteria bacterium]|nr:CBS domain-containing protein [Candidatus Kapabacteria bacterium]
MDIAVLAISVMISGYLELVASVLTNLPISIVSTMAEEGSAVGRRLKRALDEPNEARLSISLVDVVVQILAVVGMMMVANSDGSRIAIDVTLLATGLALVKVVASTIGERSADHLLRFASTSLAIVTLLSAPMLLANRLLVALTKPRSQEEEEEEAREELEALVETAREEGALDPGEYRIMTNIMQLSSIEVGDVMTPRMVVAGMSSELTVAEAIKQPELQMFSRLPIYEGADLDSVTGYVMTKDILRAALAGRQSVELTRLKRDVGYIPENITLDHALEQFLQQRQHVFMVVDEHGGVEGIITMEDVLETMLGAEIVDEADHVVDLRALAKQRRDARVARISQS